MSVGLRGTVTSVNKVRDIRYQLVDGNSVGAKAVWGPQFSFDKRHAAIRDPFPPSQLSIFASRIFFRPSVRASAISSDRRVEITYCKCFGTIAKIIRIAVERLKLPDLKPFMVIVL